MLKELSKSDWLSMLGISEKLILKVLLLRGTRNLKIQYAKHKSFFSNIFEVGSPNGAPEDVFIRDIEGIPIGYASVYGSPIASEITHVFGVL
ncbi:MAG: hypothetical protein PHQ09_01760 [Actinomycetota bacterium]|jgi:hypothetical protein|nr:hypothetical protein [Actinomycetota bacterium]